MIIPSFQQQYGIRLRDELGSMTFSEFAYFLYALNEKTPLGKIVRIRTETDQEQLKQYTSDMNRIRGEWLKKRAKRIPEGSLDAIYDGFKNAFMDFGKVVKKE